MNPIVKIRNLRKEFMPARTLYESLRRPFEKKERILAVDDISIDINKQEIVVFAGPNESGKTTILKILSCLILPTSGYAVVAGYNILSEEEKVKSSVGLISGDVRSFYWRLTLRQNLIFFSALYNLPKRKALKRIDCLSGLLDLKNRLDCQFQECSAGIRQRLAIARSLLADPQVLLMDEPFNHLDYTSSEKLKSFIKEVLVKEEKKTVLFSSHSLLHIETFADRAAVMEQGRLIKNGSAGSLAKKHDF